MSQYSYRKIFRSGDTVTSLYDFACLIKGEKYVVNYTTLDGDFVHINGSVYSEKIFEEYITMNRENKINTILKDGK